MLGRTLNLKRLNLRNEVGRVVMELGREYGVNDLMLLDCVLGRVGRVSGLWRGLGGSHWMRLRRWIRGRRIDDLGCLRRLFWMLRWGLRRKCCRRLMDPSLDGEWER